MGKGAPPYFHLLQYEVRWWWWLLSCSVVSDSLWPHSLQHTSLPCPSPSPRACSNSCPLSWWCHSTISPSVVPFSSCPQSFPSLGSFYNESALHIRRPKYFSFSLSNEYSGLISFRIDWFDLLAVQGTLKSLLQHHSSKASILQCSAFFTVQLSHPYMTTGKTTVSTIRKLGGTGCTTSYSPAQKPLLILQWSSSFTSFINFIIVCFHNHIIFLFERLLLYPNCPYF